MGIRADINADTLKWARVVAGWSEQDLAKRLNVKVPQVAAWEAGEAAPTLKQLQNAASVLGRTVASFLIPPPANTGVPATVDFRGGAHESLSHKALRELRRIETYREFYLDLPHYEEVEFTLAQFSWETVEQRADDLRVQLGVDAGAGSARSLSEWIRRVEQIGVLVFQATGIDLAEFRGVSVHHDRFPLILLNGADSEKGRIFSLFHEVSHLANGSSGLCDNSESGQQEVLANRFSAEFLMPARYVATVMRGAKRNAWVDLVSKSFGTSTLAAAIRLHNLGRIDDEELEEAQEESYEAWQKYRRDLKAKPGSPPYWRLRQRDLSATYVGAVFDALDESRIDYIDATHMLHAKIPTIDRIRDDVRSAGGAR